MLFRELHRLKRSTVSVLASVVLMVATSLADASADILPVTSFWDLSLGQPEGEVRRLKGKSATPVIPGPWCRDVLETSAPFTETWAYQDDGGVYHVYLRNRQVWSIIFYANAGVAPDFPIGAFGDSQSALEAKLGSPSLISDSKSANARWVIFENYSVAYQLQNDAVIMFAIFDPAQGTIQFCD